MVTPSSPEPSSETVGVEAEIVLDTISLGWENCAQATYSFATGSLKETFEADRSISLKPGPEPPELRIMLAPCMATKLWEGSILLLGVLTLPRAAAAPRAGWEVTSNLRDSWKKWRCYTQWRRECKNLCGRTTISTNIVLIGTELSTLSCDSFEILLGLSIGIAHLKEKTLFTNRLAVELLDYLFADITRFETKSVS